MIERLLTENIVASMGLLLVLFLTQFVLTRISKRAFDSLGENPPFAYEPVEDHAEGSEDDTLAGSARRPVVSVGPLCILILVAIWWVSVARLELNALYLVVLGALSAIPLTAAVLEIRWGQRCSPSSIQAIIQVSSDRQSP